MITNFESVHPNYGLDAAVNPPWLMVPLDSKKPLHINNAEGMTITSQSPGIAQVSLLQPNGSVPQTPDKYSSSVQFGQNARQTFSIYGKNQGRTFLEVKKGNRLITKLEVSVRRTITLNLTFNFVSDNKSSTNQSENNLYEIMLVLNGIYKDQTNIEFINNNVRKLHINKDLGPSIDYPHDSVESDHSPFPGNDSSLLVSKRDKSSHINVFFVWKIEYGKQNNRALGIAFRRDCFVDDEMISILDAAQTLGHEIAHILGILDLSKTKLVRNADTGRRERVSANAETYAVGYGNFIPRHQSNIMWEVARQIAG